MAEKAKTPKMTVIGGQIDVRDATIAPEEAAQLHAMLLNHAAEKIFAVLRDGKARQVQFLGVTDADPPNGNRVISWRAKVSGLPASLRHLAAVDQEPEEGDDPDSEVVQ